MVLSLIFDFFTLAIVQVFYFFLFLKQKFSNFQAIQIIVNKKNKFLKKKLK